MSLELAKNKLEIHSVLKTEKGVSCGSETLAETLAKCLKHDASLVLWQAHRIVWGRLENGKITLSDGSSLDAPLTLEIRAFNENEEIHLVREGETFEGRYVVDGEGTSAEYVDSLARLWGEREESDVFVTLRDKKRKLKLTIPSEESGKYLGLVTRNYIGYAESGQAGYVDYRFVKIVSAEED